MDTIAVVGSGERALAMLELLARCCFEIVSVSTSPERMRLATRRRLPAHSRGRALAEARFVDDLDAVADCSVVLDCNEATDEANHMRVLVALEERMSAGAVLAATVTDRDALARLLRRPDEFVALVQTGQEIRLMPTEHTAPGAAFAVEQLLASLGGEPSSAGFVAAVG